MYYHDTLKFNQAFKHLQAATKIAQMVNNTELQTLVHYYTGELYLEQHNPLLAKDELDCALALSKGITTQTRGRILSSCAFIQASTGTDLASIINTQKLLDEAERYTSAQKTFVSFTHARYLGDRADTFIVLKQYGKALDSLDDAIEDANVRKRGLEYLNILRAECYIKKHKPECDLATALLYQVLEQNAVNPRIYRVQYVARLHKLLAASPYGTSPEVADLGMALRAIQLKKS